MVVGYVVMPEHVHLLVTEPEVANPSTVMQVLKQRFARRVLAELRGIDEAELAQACMRNAIEALPKLSALV